MATAGGAISGFGGSVNVGGAVSNVKEWTGTINRENADVTHLGSSGWRNRLGTVNDFTGSFTTNTFLATTTGAAVFSVGAAASTTKPTISCRVNLSTGFNVPADAVEFTYDFESDGPIAIATS